jgi:hypothetical protein
METCHVNVGFKVFTAVVMNIAIFWDIVQCDPYVKRFRGAYHLHLQGRKKIQTRNRHELMSKPRC